MPSEGTAEGMWSCCRAAQGVGGHSPAQAGAVYKLDFGFRGHGQGAVSCRLATFQGAAIIATTGSSSGATNKPCKMTS